MKSSTLLASLLLLSACQTPEPLSGSALASPPVIAPASSPTAAPSPALILKKVVGALSKEDPKSQHYECKVTSAQLENLEQVKDWIEQIDKAPIIDALLFRATIPSVQIFAYKAEREILLFESYSTARYRQPVDDKGLKNITAEELIKIANQQCPYP